MALMAASSGVTISPAQLRQFQSDGYIALPHLLGADEVAEAKSALSEMMQRFHRAALDGKCEYKPSKPEVTSNYDGASIRFPNRKAHLAYEPGIDPLPMSPEEAENYVRNVYMVTDEALVFARLAADPRIAGVCAQLLGEEVVNFASMAMSKPAKIGGEKPWHQDNAYFKWLPLELVIGCWIALDDARVANGCMHVLPGEHGRGALKHIHTFDCQIAPDRLSRAKPTPVPLPPGGAMFFLGMLPHQTPPNRSDQRRRALQFHYRGVSAREAEPDEYNRAFAEADGTPASCAATAPRAG